MSSRALLVALFALFWSNPVAQAQAPRPKPPVELTAEIIGQSYCATHSDAITLSMNLRLRYTNVGKEKLILYRGHDLFYQTRIRTAAGVAQAY